MVLLFTHQNSPRLHYIVGEVFERRLGLSVNITHDLDSFLSENNAIKLAYTPVPVEDEKNPSIVWVYNSGFLFEDFVREPSWKPVGKTLNIHVTDRSIPPQITSVLSLFPLVDLSILSSTREIESQEITSRQLPFDLFSSVFWCLTRYEEVQWGIAENTDSKIQTDPHGRFPAKASLLSTLGCLDTPIVDQWVCILGKAIGSTVKNSFQIVPTADIDMALRYGGRSLVTQLGSAVRDLFNSPSLFYERLRVLLGGKDPYAMDQEVVHFLRTADIPDALTPKLFVLAAENRDVRNKQISHSSLRSELHRLKSHKDYDDRWLGIHPSWQEKRNALKTLTSWKNEMYNLESVHGKKLKDSRFHYIHLHFPQSYQLILQLGIETDWSMGYPDAVGFRAGTAIPYRWYDVNAEKETSLGVVPFCIMDVTCKNYLKLTPSDSIILANSLKQKIQSCGGVFCFIFHNESVSESQPWIGWREVISSWSNLNHTE